MLALEEILFIFNYLKPFFGFIPSVLVKVSIAVKRHHDHGNFYKGKHLIRVACTFRDLVHYHHGMIRWHVGRHGAGEGVESLTS